MSSEPLAGRTGIVTGAASGIGRATTLLAAERGAEVIAVDLDGDGLRETVAAASEVRVKSVVCDVSDEKAVADGVGHEMAVADSPPAFLVNCAGTEGPMAPMLDISVADFDRVMAINVRSMFVMTKLVLPGMFSAGTGAIVNIASVASLGAASWMSTYTVSKHAVLGLTRAAVAEAAEQGVRITAICPGPIDTTMQARAQRLAPDPEEFRSRQEAGIPQRRYGRPEEVAGLAVFLVGDEADYVNGATITLDGGLTAVL